MLDILSLLLMHILKGFFIFALYYKILFQRFNPKVKYIYGSILYGTYMTIGRDLIPEPCRTIFGLLFLAMVINKKQIKVEKTALILSFFIVTIVDFSLVFMLGAISYGIGLLDFRLFALILLLPSMFLTYSIIYLKVNFSNLSSSIKETDMKVIVFFVTLLLLLVYGIVRATYRDGEIIYFLFFSLVATMIVMVIFISYALWNNFKRNKIENEKMKLEYINFSLKEENQSLTSRWHGIKEVVVANSIFFLQFEKELDNMFKQNLTEKDLFEKISRIKVFNSEMGDDLSMIDLEEEIKLLDFPDTWVRLKLRLSHFIYEARNKGIHVIVDNKFENWNEIDIPEVAFIKLVANIVSNSIKELEKININSKLVKISFLSNTTGYLIVEVHDNAMEFSIDILKKLGKRQNSTNETGDGYFEIFQILDIALASFELIENKRTKMVRITFDGCNDRTITSGYRTDELLLELGDSILDVL